MSLSKASLPRHAWTSRLRQALGLERNVVVMSGAGILQGLGSGLWASYLPKVLEALGARGWMIGAFGTIGALLVIGGTVTVLGLICFAWQRPRQSVIGHRATTGAD